MAKIISTSTIEFDYKLNQDSIKEYAENMFKEAFPDINRLLPAFDNTNIKTRNFCAPMEFFSKDWSFSHKNKMFTDIAIEYGARAIECNFNDNGIDKKDITDIIYVNTTGLTTPSLDAYLINKLNLREDINRYPIWGLGCAGGVSGIAKAKTICDANPNAVVVLIGVELCTLTFRRNDVTKSNFIATSLFSDGIASCVIAGDETEYASRENLFRIINSKSKIYYDALDVMGWEFIDDGFKVIFSKDIPNIVNENASIDLLNFLQSNEIEISDVNYFVLHPGGAKVLEAYSQSLNLPGGSLSVSEQVLSDYGNMSSVTVLYVLDEFLEAGLTGGYGVMAALGPGFSSEAVLLKAE